MQSQVPDRPKPRGAHPRRPQELDSAPRVTLAVALTVTFVFLLVTAAGLGWLLSADGPGSGASEEASGEGGNSAAPETPGGDSPASEGTVEDPAAGLSYQLPGEGWRRLGDDEVPAEYSSYAVYGSPDDPEAFLVTGSTDLGPVEPLPVAGARLALDSLGGLLSDPGSLRVGPSGATEVDGASAFGAALEGGGSYGRFLLVETGDRRGGFVVGLNTGGGEEVSTAIDGAFDTVGLL
ncbi:MULTISPECIES: hypothetical protein [unclassified Nocardiopsis]|uniref:hypothetical protein n=1 Tax=unclassified Nocardiopsis TaxID=2649073 RepID=UPI00135BF0E3|nr:MULTISPECIES: hypothetical protein [unclassified Nocardiopsis]